MWFTSTPMTICLFAVAICGWIATRANSFLFANLVRFICICGLILNSRIGLSAVTNANLPILDVLACSPCYGRRSLRYSHLGYCQDDHKEYALFSRSFSLSKTTPKDVNANLKKNHFPFFFLIFHFISWQVWQCHHRSCCHDCGRYHWRTHWHGSLLQIFSDFESQTLIY